MSGNGSNFSLIPVGVAFILAPAVGVLFLITCAARASRRRGALFSLTLGDLQTARNLAQIIESIPRIDEVWIRDADEPAGDNGKCKWTDLTVCGLATTAGIAYHHAYMFFQPLALQKIPETQTQHVLSTFILMPRRPVISKEDQEIQIGASVVQLSNH